MEMMTYDLTVPIGRGELWTTAAATARATRASFRQPPQPGAIRHVIAPQMAASADNIGS